MNMKLGLFVALGAVLFCSASAQLEQDVDQLNKDVQKSVGDILNMIPTDTLKSIADRLRRQLPNLDGPSMPKMPTVFEIDIGMPDMSMPNMPSMPELSMPQMPQMPQMPNAPSMPQMPGRSTVNGE